MNVILPSTATIVFSLDRPAQLDLLLRSIKENAPRLANPIHVLYKASNERFAEGYRIVQKDHRNVSWWREKGFQHTFTSILDYLEAQTVMCATDDSVFYRPFKENPGSSPAAILRDNSEVICVSLRLGLNTTHCYSLDKPHRPMPRFQEKESVLHWVRAASMYDFNYAGSLDTHVFRTNQFRALIAKGWMGEPAEYANPNELEDVLSNACVSAKLPLMACYRQSYTVSLPLNLVNSTHTTNRYGGLRENYAGPMNDRFLEGNRLLLSTVKPDKVRAAHMEAKPKWKGGRQ